DEVAQCAAALLSYFVQGRHIQSSAELSADGEGRSLVVSPQGNPQNMPGAKSATKPPLKLLRRKTDRRPKVAGDATGRRDSHELVIISGMSGAGKASALKTF